MSLLGNRVMRTEDPKFLTVGGTYVGDLRLDGTARVAFVRSTMAHAILTAVDTSAAAGMPGVLAVVTAADIAHLPKSPAPYGVVSEPFLRPLLATDRVRFVGEAIVAVIAETLQQAVDACAEVVVDYEPLPVVVDPRDAARDENTLFEAGTNVCFAMPNLMTADFSGCEVVVEHEVLNQRVAVAPMEPRAYAAEWRDGRLIVHASCQGAHQVRGEYEKVYSLPPEQVRVITPDVGGGFGAKGFPHTEELILGELARVVGRPVLYTETRTENMTGMVHGRGQVQTVRIGGSRDGTITAYSVDLLQDAGAYPGIGAVLPGAGFLMLTGTYGITNVGFNARSVVTNTTPVGAFRGAGRPEATAAIERAVDLFAAEIGMDPAEVRRRNLLPPFAEGHTTITGTTYDSGRYGDALEACLLAAGYDELREEQRVRRERGDRLQLGIGVSTYVEVTAMGGGPDGITEFGAVELQADGSVLAKTGSTPHGQGHVTTWAMLISDELGVPMDRITVVFGDTDVIPHSNVTGGSRSVQIAGSAMVDASQRLVELARTFAADLLEANADDIVHDRDSGQFHVAGTPSRAVSWADLGAAPGGDALAAISQFAQSAASFPFGSHVAVVELDVETGHVTLVRHVAVDDCGVVVNPLLCDGQVHGGLAQGAAQALLEEVRYDEDGNPLTANFADYGIISMTELPSFERNEMQTRSPLNPLGAKGIGEAGTIGATPAVHSAVVDALAPYGVRHVDMPCTPEKVWRAMHASGE
jgi:carbon-monoxide dehydrogenase large subunit